MAARSAAPVMGIISHSDKLTMTNTLLLRIGPLLIAAALAGCNKGPTAPPPVADPANPGGGNPVVTHTPPARSRKPGGGPIGGVSLTTDRL